MNEGEIKMVPLSVKGIAWCFGNNINTDLIYPGKYLSITEPLEMGSHAMAGIDPAFSSKVQPGDILVVGSNFGCGSSREQAAIALKQAGVSAVIGISFARIFFRNIINQGVPAFQSSDAVELLKTGDNIQLDFQNKSIKNLTNGESCRFEPLPDFLMEIIEAGGNIEFLRRRLCIK
jgi:3-isopropylmalate/(R)-2-methylmalate dehydratase small subunit